MIRRRHLAGLGLAVGLMLALVLGLWRPGDWRRGSTPRFIATAALVVVVSAALRWRRRPGRGSGA
ncbi:MAG: hypothetical protein ACTHM9_03105 [Gemmatimonadales bacterium]